MQPFTQRFTVHRHWSATRSRGRRPRCSRSALLMVFLLFLIAAPFPVAALPQGPPPASTPAPAQSLPQATPTLADEWPSMRDAMIRLPLAAILGAALALRPKRRGTPDRNTAVVETQIVLAVVGAVIMLVVGASLARAFGIVGAANLIRYR